MNNVINGRAETVARLARSADRARLNGDANKAIRIIEEIYRQHDLTPCLLKDDSIIRNVTKLDEVRRIVRLFGMPSFV